ncbi:D-alanyl-D-alanine carboxypeptidase/D-alanyl-D-alanine endopeptidase [Paeniglutamicibacter kerguelensis]|uniref:D-alanyl-D-alanine carboxypeptidase/D-alanyl-D-alanine-endopeptidase (Penicillin-binding protein 4) n=1 Tax=Paeniglutamicibacter kerguelensis TaxID=254788 RepID=A0ABS4XIT7_9MICC|nr:D-alanyl-D-alanine carboxypeptidase/D-alanyl-D-alanine-endopeptidase [Paeniglutamicibacter kerguelensis]MBP2388323.1 D-alanyl-D-alanine carboxypeptidase/D-alanyl-D-alanine-endopeptidase (penicillin-binding protein 4) [Paeniglutamicibacter kerguelensis]
MKRARPLWGTWSLVLAIGVALGMVALMLIPVMAGTAAPKPVEPQPAPQVVSPATPTALPPLDPEAPEPEAGVLGAGLDGILSSIEPDSKVSASVVDIATGREIYSRSGSQAGIPASSLKVLTAIAATDVLGEDHRFTTKVLLKDPQTLVLVGGGDVLLGSGKDSTAVSGRAGLETLAARAAKEILKAQAAGQLGPDLALEVDDSLFTGPGLNPAWDESLVTTNNIAIVAPLALYGARADSGPKSPRVKDPAMAAATSFAKSLRTALGAGAKAPRLSTDISRGQAGAGATELASVSSAPLGEQVRFMLEVSDNYVAETLGRLTAIAKGNPGDYQHGAKAVQEKIAELGIRSESLGLVDTSGLADGNRVSPLTLADALKFAATSNHVALRDLSYQLPVAGATGTLGTRLNTASTRGIVRAKTGSLVDVSSLSGITLTKDGRALGFSIMVHSHNGELAPHKDTLDAAATYLTGCGCR